MLLLQYRGEVRTLATCLIRTPKVVVTGRIAMRSDLVVKLVKAGVTGDREAARIAAEALAAEERAKRHCGVAERISYALASEPKPRVTGTAVRNSPSAREATVGIQRRYPDRPIETMYLTKENRESCNMFIEEQRRADLLRSYGIDPRHRLLLVGPPGNGKTTLAEVIASELVLPLFVVRYDAIITSYLGETAQRLRRLFDYVRTEPCVLFFDEFDAVGKERGDIHESGEIKRVVSNLLLQLDDLPSYCVFVAATNHPELLDRASWRRFELKLNMEKPNARQMSEYISLRLKEFDIPPDVDIKQILNLVKPDSFSDAEGFCNNVRRRYILNQGRTSLTRLVKEQAASWAHHK